MKTIATFSLNLILLIFISPNIIGQSLAPISDFSGTPYLICSGDAVQFSDLSSNTPTSWNWVFKGGSPGTSTLQNPSVIYNTPGKYDVILTSTNLEGSHSKGQLNMVTVMVCSSISEYHENSNFNIFPNPAQSFINVLANADAEFTLYDAIGAVQMKGITKKEAVIKISLDNLPSGIYFLSFQDGVRTKSMKVIKE